MRKYAVMLLAVMLAGVSCEALLAASKMCSTCFGTGYETCGICHGSGRCVTCGGRGTTAYIPDFSGNGSGGYVICSACNGTKNCWRCHGLRKEICHTCNGAKYVETFDPLPNPTPTPTPNPVPNPTPDPKPESLSSEAADKIAETLGTTSDSVSYISSSDMSAPQAPTSRITGALDILGLEIISTQGSLNVSQSGYYAFPMTVPANLVGTNTKLTVYVADRDEFGSASFSPSAVTSPLIPAAIFTEAGGKVTTLPKTIIAAANLGADTARTFSTHIAKAKTKTDDDDNSKGVSSSGGGGCSSFPAVLALTLTALITLRKSRR